MSHFYNTKKYSKISNSFCKDVKLNGVINLYGPVDGGKLKQKEQTHSHTITGKASLLFDQKAREIALQQFPWVNSNACKHHSKALPLYELADTRSKAHKPI